MKIFKSFKDKVSSVSQQISESDTIQDSVVNEEELLTLKKQVLDFVEKKGKATWKEVHSFILKQKGHDPNDRDNRGMYSSYFSGHSQYLAGYSKTDKRNKESHGLLMRPTKEDPRYLEKDGKFYVVKYDDDLSMYNKMKSFENLLINESSELIRKINFAKKLDRNVEGLPKQRELIEMYFSDDLSNRGLKLSEMTDKEVVSFLSDFVKNTKSMKKESDLVNKYLKKLDELFKSGKIRVDIAGRLNEDKILNFIKPLLSDAEWDNENDKYDFVERAKLLEFDVTGAEVTRGITLYSGTINNGYEEVGFIKVENNFSSKTW